MASNETTDRILTIPNLISLLRVAMVPVFWWVLLARDDVTLAAVLILVTGSTDWIDGYLARRLDQVSRLGAALDPVADRLMIVSAVIGGLITGVVPMLIGLALIGRELFMAVMSLIVVAKRAPVLEVRYLGKLATFVLYGAIPLFYLAAAGVLAEVASPAAWVTAVAGLALYWTVAIQYVGDVRRRLADVEFPASPQEN